MNIHRLSKIVEGKVITKNKKEIVVRPCIDSRELVDDGIFIIIGNVQKYKEEILKKASVIIGENNLGKNIGFIQVEDSIKALKKMASYMLEKSQTKIIAITGSNGKTTLKELTALVLQSKYKVLKNTGNENNIIGVSKTLLRLDQSYDYCILELGMNHLNEISELSLLTRPYYALITNIGTAHIGNLGSKKDIFKAKIEILDGMDVNNLIVNSNDYYLKQLKCLKVGTRLFSDLRISKIKITLFKTSFLIKKDNFKKEVILNYGGFHYPILIGMALLLGTELGIDLETGINTIHHFKPIDGRLNIIKLENNNYLIDDCYNASLESFSNVSTLVKDNGLKKIFIIGDILETGKYSDIIHLKVIKKLCKIPNSIFWCVGNYFQKHQKKLKNARCFNVTEIINLISHEDFYDTIFILKASHKFNFEQISETIKNKY